MTRTSKSCAYRQRLLLRSISAVLSIATWPMGAIGMNEHEHLCAHHAFVHTRTLIFGTARALRIDGDVSRTDPNHFHWGRYTDARAHRRSSRVSVSRRILDPSVQQEREVGVMW